MPDAWIVPMISALAAFAGAWGGQRVELRYLKRDLVGLARRVARLENAEFNLPLVGDAGEREP